MPAESNEALVRTLATVALHRADGYPTSKAIQTEVAKLRQAYSITDTEAETIIAAIESALGVSMTIGSVLVAREFEPWLAQARATITPYYWDRYRTFLLSASKMPPQVIDVLDQVTERILWHCENPLKLDRWDRRGMVVGQVQSGKTGNYAGLICKAADAGYRLVVVIAGVTNKLRNQTQERVDEGFVGRDSSKVFSRSEDKYVGVGHIDRTRHPSSFTSSTRDFSKSAATSLGISIANNTEPVVFVIKKNATTLKNLLEWLRQNNTISSGDRIDLPMLLIDDEADNASVNIAYDRNEVSRINGQIRDLLALFTRSTYVGYTATPFANIFIDPDTDDEMLGQDVFPRDFIVNLDPPTNYFGPNRVFQDAPDTFLVPIEDAEDELPLNHKNGFDVTALPASLVDALRMFVVARAVRLLRGDTTAHMSMLVNATRFVSVQDALKNHLHRHLRQIETAVRVDGAKSERDALANSHIAELKRVWRDHYGDAVARWADVQRVLLEAVSGTGVRAINSRSGDALDYADHRSTGLTAVVVGGFALSRGVTLEGLMTTYFYRRSLMYDTLMQMGRWFGYRDGYEDLCRIWMSTDAQGWYEHITEAIDLLRLEFREMEAAGSAPKDFGLKVRNHPASLLITARNKIGTGTPIRHAVGLGNSMVETTALARDSAIIAANIGAAGRLVGALGGMQRAEPPDWGSGHMFRSVPADTVLRFIRDFQNDDLSYLTQTEPVARYIEAGAEGALAHWDVLFVSLGPAAKSSSNPPYDELGLHIIPQTRAAGARSDRERIVVSDNARVASRGVERNGVSSELVEQAEEEYRHELQTQGRKGGSRANYPDRIYRAKRQKPLLIVHILRMTWGGREATATDRDPIVAWGISFPRPATPEQNVEYVVNRTWLETNMSLEADDDEEDVGADDD